MLPFAQNGSIHSSICAGEYPAATHKVARASLGKKCLEVFAETTAQERRRGCARTFTQEDSLEGGADEKRQPEDQDTVYRQDFDRASGHCFA